MAAKARHYGLGVRSAVFVLRPNVGCGTVIIMEPKTLKRWKNRLPHWEVERGIYFITIRCHGTLPQTVQRRINELKISLSAIEAQSSEFDQLQRQIFLTAEKYLDRNEGFAPFRESACCEALIQQLKVIAPAWEVADWVIMPNHVHFVLLDNGSAISLSKILPQFKGRSARACNIALGRSGHFWQRDWFDRWMRSEAELSRVQSYIAQNPVKGKLVQEAKDYPWWSPS